jgi:DNA-binding NarL/FixJ family response regulator
VLLVDVQGMTGDILATLLRDDPDCVVLPELTGRTGLLDAVRRQRPDLVVIGLRASDLGPEWDRLFVEFPAVRVMAVTPNGGRTCLFMEPRADDLLAARRKPEVTDKGGDERGR